MRIRYDNEWIAMVVAIAVYVTNTLSTIASFQFRVPKWVAGLVIMGLMVAYMPLARITLPWPLPQLPHLLLFAALALMIKDNIPSMAYFHCMICAFTIFLRVLASFIVEPFTGYGSDVYYIAWGILTLWMLACYALLVHRYHTAWRDSLDRQLSAPVMTLFALSAMVCWQTLRVVYIAPNMISEAAPLRADIGFLALPFALTGLILTMSVSYLYAQRRATDQIELRLAQAALSSGHSHYEKLAQLSETVRSIRHDARHHLSALQSLIAAGNILEAQRYIDEVQQHNADSELKLYCQSPVINALLNAHAARCHGEGIAFSCEIDLPASETYAEYELCIIIGNLLENALEGSHKTPDGAPRYIDLVIRPHGDQYGIMVENSFSGAVSKDERGLLSTKPDATAIPGIGIQSIRAIAKRHGGEYYPKWSDGVFTAYVVLSRSKG